MQVGVHASFFLNTYHMVCTVLCLCLCVRVCLSACLSASVCVSAFARVLKSLFAGKYTSATYPVSVVLPGGRCHHPVYGNLRGASRPMWLCRFQGSEFGAFAQGLGGVGRCRACRHKGFGFAGLKVPRYRVRLLSYRKDLAKLIICQMMSP